MKALKNERGITLIALVVTIIVLIVLAGVSINLVLGENGIIEKAKIAKLETEKATAKQQIQMEIAERQIDALTTNSINKTDLEAILEEQGTINYNADGTIKSITITDLNYEMPLTEIWSGTIIEPKKDVNGVEQGKSGYLGGTYDDPYIPVGFKHFGSANWNSGYQIKDELGNVFVWVPCVTTQTEKSTADGVQIFKKTTTGNYNSNNLTLAGDSSKVTDVEPTNAVKTSVGTYEGFYIAAYEAGVPVIDGIEMDPVYCKQYINTEYKARSMPGTVAWTWLTRSEAQTAAANMIDTASGVNSGLITGECWDTTLQWITNTTDSTYAENSEGKGNYTSDSQSLYRTAPENGKYVKNNIYDMAGNVMENTAESYLYSMLNSYQVLRGGASNTKYASSRGGGTLNGHSLYGFRVIIYK